MGATSSMLDMAGHVVQADLNHLLPTLPSGSVDLVLADPGYGLKKATWDQEPDYGPWLREVLRVLRPTGSAYVFGETETVASHWASFPSPKRMLTWAVTNRVSPLVKTWQPTSEGIVMLWKGEPWFDREAVREPYGPDYARHRGRTRPPTPGRFGKRASQYSDAPGALPRDVLKGPGLSGKVGAREGLGHPAQKPLWLMERLIKASCPPGGLILDLFAGVATASVAAHRLGRRWIAVEQDPNWCQAALERLKREGAPAKLETYSAAADSASWRAAVEEELAWLKKSVMELRGALPAPVER